MLYPLGRYLVVEPVEEMKTNSGVLVPEGVNTDISAFKLVSIVEPYAGCDLLRGMRVLVPSHMIEEASFFGKTYYLVTENNIIGFYSEESL